MISLLTLLILIPRLFRDVTMATCLLPPNMPPGIMAKLVSRARNLRSSLQGWYPGAFGPGNIPIHEGSVFCHRYSRILVLYYICTICCNRLNTCMYRAGELSEILEMEEESQRCASIIVSLHREQEAYSRLRSSLLLIQKLPVAEAVIGSPNEWRKHLTVGMVRYQQLFLMPKQIFQRWCDLFGRRTV